MQDGLPDPQQPSAEPPVRRPWSALAFRGFGVVIVVDVALAGMCNPDRGQFEFWAKSVVIFGGGFVWALWIARRLTRGTGVVAAYAFLSTLSAFILIGATIQLIGGYPEHAPFPGESVMQAARAISGLYVLVAWVIVVWGPVTARRVAPVTPAS